jgi:hypothetical protein
LLAEAGFTDLALDVIAIHSVVDGPESVAQILPAVFTLEPLVEAELLAREAFESLREFEMRFHAGELRVDGMFGLLVVTGTAAQPPPPGIQRRWPLPRWSFARSRRQTS